MRDRATATLTTIVVDDEQLARDELSPTSLRDFPSVELAATGSNGLEAVETGPRSWNPISCSWMSTCPGWTAWG